MSDAKGSRFTHLASLPALSVLGVLLLLAAVAMSTTVSGRLQASAKADFSLSSSPASVTAQQGQVATYTISQQKLNGFNGSVGLAVGNLPAGSTAAFSPQTLSTKTTSTLTVTVGAAAATGSRTITVTGSGGGLSRSVSLTLVVTAAAAPGFTVSASPSSATLLPGDTAAYTVSTSALNGFTGTIGFAVSGAPAGATTTFTPATTAVGGSSMLQVATKNNTPGGNYTLTVTGTFGTTQQSTSVVLVITTTGKQFGITAPSVTVPGPGSQVPLDLTLTNPNNQSLQVTNLTVAVSSVTKAAGAPANRPCTVADYGVLQFTGAYPVTIEAGQSISLSALGRSSTTWPVLQMLNSTSNQDGCKGATVTLSFSGAGQG